MISVVQEKLMDHFHLMLLLIVTGFILLGVGFSYRDNEWGIKLIGLGALCAFGPILFKLYIAFH
jgi:hypothetical protein